MKGVDGIGLKRGKNKETVSDSFYANLERGGLHVKQWLYTFFKDLN